MRKVNILFPVIASFILISKPVFSEDGEKLFKANCGVCHTVGKGKLVGPDLKGTNSRHEGDWLLKWIKSSQTLVKSGDKKAVQIFNDNASLIMPDQMLNEDEIKSVLSFIENKEKSDAASLQNVAVEKSDVTPPLQQANNSLLSIFGFSGYIMLMLTGMLLVIIWVMSMTIKKLIIDIQNKNKQ